MKLVLITFLIIQLSNVLADSEPTWICSDKLHMEFIDTTANNKKGVWIYSGAVRSILTFDIDNINAIFVSPIKYNNKNKKNKCEYKTITKGGRFYIKFTEPFNGHKLIADVKIPTPDFIVDKKREYVFAIIKIINGKKIHYYKNFTFNLSSSY